MQKYGDKDWEQDRVFQDVDEIQNDITAEKRTYMMNKQQQFVTNL